MVLYPRADEERPLHYLTDSHCYHAILQDFTARNGCHAITPLLPICRPIHALRGPGHSHKVVSRHGQVFNSVLYQTLVISLTQYLTAGNHRTGDFFAHFFLRLKKV